MDDELEVLHKAFVAQLKESATKTYNLFSNIYEKIEDKDAINQFMTLIRNNDYLFSSLGFYNDRFKDLNREEDYLYVAQLFSLQIKASHNVCVLAKKDNNINLENIYSKKKDEYKVELYFYYLLGKDLDKIGPILLTFVKDAVIDNNLQELANNKYRVYLNKQ